MVEAYKGEDADADSTSEIDSSSEEDEAVAMLPSHDPDPPTQ